MHQWRTEAKETEARAGAGTRGPSRQAVVERMQSLDNLPLGWLHQLAISLGCGQTWLGLGLGLGPGLGLGLDLARVRNDLVRVRVRVRVRARVRVRVRARSGAG